MDLVAIDEIPPPDKVRKVKSDDLLEIYKISKQMEELCNRKGGIGISAVQVGLPWELFLIKSDGTLPFWNKGEYCCFVNSNYEPLDIDKNEDDSIDSLRIVDSLEGCLSIRSSNGQLRLFHVKRLEYIRFFGSILMDNLVLEDFDLVVSQSQQGIVIQHEVDHQHGKLISDGGQEVFLFR